MVETYDNNSISQLKGAQRIRKRPESMLGSKGIEGAQHTLHEIVGNATDEQLAGYGNKLIIKKYEDGSLSVRDFGRGVPLGWNEKEQQWNYFLIYEELYAGGKYDDNQKILREYEEEDKWDDFDLKDHPYMITVGLNGVGASATQCSSEYCIVESYRDGEVSRMDYKDGAHVLDELKVSPTDEPNGTFVHWKPDKKVFTDVNIKSTWLNKICKSLSYVSGFDIVFDDCGKVKEYRSTPMEDIMRQEAGEVISGSNFTHIVDESGDICICYADIVIGPGGRGKEYFHNKVEIRGGVHSSALAIAESDFFKMVGKENSVSVRDSDYSGKLSAIISTLSNKVSYRGQTKDSLDDTYVYMCIEKCIANMLKMEYQKGTKWLMDIIEDVLSNARNRIAVAEMSKTWKDIEKSTKKMKASEKFRTCTTYEKGDVEATEYWILEGDSAGGTFREARDPYFQCYQTIRGKSLNIFKATLDKLLANREIKDMVSILGCGVDMGIDDFESFDINKLRVGKIIFGTDADIDGLHIRMLLFIIFYKMFPQLLYEGRVYIAETPLYVLSLWNNEDVYCLTDEERDEKIKEIGESNIREITRFKGLGETSAEQLWDTTLNPEKRVLRQIKIDPEDTDVYDVLSVLFGKSTYNRKKAILGSMLDNEGIDFIELMESIDETVGFIDSLGMNMVDTEEVYM